MTAKGTPAHYAARRSPEPFDPEEARAQRRNRARALGMFDEFSERPAFEAWFRDSRKGRGDAYLASAFVRWGDGTYAHDETQSAWWTWQNAVGAGRILPRFDPIQAAADRLAGSQA